MPRYGGVIYGTGIKYTYILPENPSSGRKVKVPITSTYSQRTALASILGALGPLPGLATEATTEATNEVLEEVKEELRAAQEWDEVLTEEIVDKLEALRLASVAAGVNTVTGLQALHIDFATLGTTITVLTTTVVGELQFFQTAILDKGDEIISEFETSREWDTEMTEQLLSKMDEIRAANVAAGTDLGTKLTALHNLTQLASDLGITQGSTILAKLQAVGISAEIINSVLDTSRGELKRIRRIGELAIGEEVLEEDID